MTEILKTIVVVRRNGYPVSREEFKNGARIDECFINDCLIQITLENNGAETLNVRLNDKLLLEDEAIAANRGSIYEAYSKDDQDRLLTVFYEACRRFRFHPVHDEERNRRWMRETKGTGVLWANPAATKA